MTTLARAHSTLDTCYVWIRGELNVHSLSMTQRVKQQWFEQCHQLEQVEYGEGLGYEKTRLEENGDKLIKFEIRVKRYTNSLIWLEKSMVLPATLIDELDGTA